MNQENNQFNQNSFNSQTDNVIPNMQGMSDNLNQSINTKTQPNMMSQSVQSNPSLDLMNQQINNNIYQQPSIQPEINQNIQSNNMNNKLNNKPSFNNKKIFIIVGIILVVVIGILLVLNMNKDKSKEGILKKGTTVQQGSYKCKRADVSTLHTEKCSKTDSMFFCSVVGLSGKEITYGNENVTEGVLTSGDAFDCDVNGDGTYSPETERFYYVSDLYDTTKKGYNSEVAVLIYYNNTSADINGNITPDNTIIGRATYDSNNINYKGPVSAKAQLPTTKQWSNVSLVNQKRQILTEKATSSTSGGSLPVYNYSGYSARLLTVQEINKACNFEVGSHQTGELDKCNYLMENTEYSSSSMGTSGYWLETPEESSSSLIWYVDSYCRYVYYASAYTSYRNGVRPVIEVLKSEILY